MTIGYQPLHGYFNAHHLTLEGTDEGAFTRSLSSARVEMNPHQVNAALFALSSPLSKGVLLADEVGLGKTIEAGLVISQRWAEMKRRIILIVPASLRKQWEQELFEKFSLRSTILELATYKKMVSSGKRRPFEDAGNIVICSYAFAAGKADELRSVNWDLVVFDEAHKLRNVYKKGVSKRAKELKAALQDSFKILLTATPLHNSLLELYGIVSIIDEEHFGGINAFKAQYVGASANPANMEILRERLNPVCHRTLRRQVQEAGQINFKRRHAVTFSFDPTDAEWELYTRLSDFLQRTDTVSYGEHANQLVVLQIRKILGSSTFAISKYLETLLARLHRHQAASVDMTDDLDDFSVVVEEDIDDSWDDEEPSDEVDPEKVAAEIVEVKAMLDLARSIGSNAKGDKLVSQLPSAFEQIVEKGGQRKAVIFTESVRTQKYLKELLSERGYRGQVVILNGSNSDPDSRAIYKAWKEKHEGTDKISGSRTADMKAALVEAFKQDDKTIFISTESGAEGINLQFCSLLINFDLPWNPQRVEQRIGRCHRYGQKIDVTVVNMLNLKNKTEERIYELLSEKFHLFDGVFGASDEVLGSIQSGVAFEKEVLKIVQKSRTDEEAEAEFKKLEAELQDKIDADIEAARKSVLEQMDGEVISKLHSREKKLTDALDDFARRLMITARAEFPEAHFPSDALARFVREGQTHTTEWPVADDNDWQFFRISDGLGEQTVKSAMERDYLTQVHQMTFHPDRYPFTGKVGALDDLKGQSGWLKVSKAKMPTPKAGREELLFSCYNDAGERIDSDIAKKLMVVPASPMELCQRELDPLTLDRLENEAFNGFSKRVKEENYGWVLEEETRLDRYADDIQIEIDAKIKELEALIKERSREKRDPMLSMEEKIGISREVKKLQGDRDKLVLTMHEQVAKVRQDVSDKLDDFMESLSQEPVLDPLFILRWSVA
ncbi:SNF2-related protein [Algimonas porphyrae]|uniref:SNF2-related protein n=1 Tax=Algimonas porphyrae TaxID=1128113 RepID=UPI00352B2BBE